ncbi:MAG TPA: hypothetical protein EYQ31_14965, partial [Candidatus Handelsmanbacteria bacterium]|nr:hypothetical protein [Candidatus Handelsmanbacteria bacterium]
MGFALERKFDLRPQLAGFIWDDGGADISWRHFDHPTVFIFRRSGSAKATRFPRPDIYLLRTRQAAQTASIVWLGSTWMSLAVTRLVTALIVWLASTLTLLVATRLLTA